MINRSENQDNHGAFRPPATGCPLPSGVTVPCGLLQAQSHSSRHFASSVPVSHNPKHSPDASGSVPAEVHPSGGEWPVPCMRCDIPAAGSPRHPSVHAQPLYSRIRFLQFWPSVRPRCLPPAPGIAPHCPASATVTEVPQETRPC